MVKLFNHQQIALGYLRMNNSFALFLEQGTGKTLPTLIRIGELLSTGRAKNALVVCPKAVIGSWERDVEKLDEDAKSACLEKMTVINYDRVWRDPNYYQQKWDIIVLDEAHYIKRHSTKRSKACLQMSCDAKYRYILTGTPINNGQLESIWALYAFLKPYRTGRGKVYSEIFGGSYYKFLDDYAYLNQWHQPYKYHNLSSLQRIINSYSYRVLKSECLDLPDKLPDEIYDIECLEKDKYNRLMKTSAIEEMDIVAENPLARLTKLRQLCSGYISNEGEITPVKCEKIAVLKEFMENWEKKLVIFAQYTYSIDAISKLLLDMCISHMVLDGRTKYHNCWKMFQSDPDIQVIVCQYESASAGIDLYAADTMLFYEPTLSSNTLEQAKDRIHRVGQNHKCSYIHFITKGTVERAIYRTVSNYGDFNRKLFEEYMETYQKGVK